MVCRGAESVLKKLFPSRYRVFCEKVCVVPFLFHDTGNLMENGVSRGGISPKELSPFAIQGIYLKTLYRERGRKKEEGRKRKGTECRGAYSSDSISCTNWSRRRGSAFTSSMLPSWSISLYEGNEFIFRKFSMAVCCASGRL